MFFEDLHILSNGDAVVDKEKHALIMSTVKAWKAFYRGVLPQTVRGAGFGLIHSTLNCCECSLKV